MRPPSLSPSAALLATLACGLLTAPSLAQKPGTSERTLEVAGATREYILHIPKGYKHSPKQEVPLVLMLHGRGSNAKGAASAYYGWKTLSDKERFVVAFPSAIGSPTSWRGSWKKGQDSDAPFLAELIDRLDEQLHINSKRVYMTGHSSGGFMSYSFGVTHPQKLAAIGPIAGLVIDESRPASPISVLSMHGMADKIVPFGKEGSWGTPTAFESAELFSRHNKCKVHEQTSLLKGKVHLDTWTIKKQSKSQKKGPASFPTVRFYSLEGAGHGWPQKGKDSIGATETLWDFFKTQERPQSKATKKKK